MKTISLNFIWGIRLKLRAEGDRLWAEGSKLRADGDNLWAEGDRLRAEGSKLWAEGSKLRADGDKLWAEGVIEAYGNVPIEWKSSTHCIVDRKDEYHE